MKLIILIANLTMIYWGSDVDHVNKIFTKFEVQFQDTPMVNNNVNYKRSEELFTFSNNVHHPEIITQENHREYLSLDVQSVESVNNSTFANRSSFKTNFNNKFNESILVVKNLFSNIINGVKQVFISFFGYFSREDDGLSNYDPAEENNNDFENINRDSPRGCHTQRDLGQSIHKKFPSFNTEQDFPGRKHKHNFSETYNRFSVPLEITPNIPMKIPLNENNDHNELSNGSHIHKKSSMTEGLEDFLSNNKNSEKSLSITDKNVLENFHEEEVKENTIDNKKYMFIEENSHINYDIAVKELPQDPIQDESKNHYSHKKFSTSLDIIDSSQSRSNIQE
jgi:hypothetical protein